MCVLAGPVSLRLGEETTELGAGEAAEFDCHTPHGVSSATSEPSEVLALFNPRRERIHLGGD
jgi:quercetin dioxygenase-like cupin family protein